MNINIVYQIQRTLFRLEDISLIDKIVDKLYSKMLDDYRINRFFSSKPVSEQTDALKNYLKALVGEKKILDEDLLNLLNNYFIAGFGRTNTSPSAVAGNDFAFLLDIVGGREIREIIFLSNAHSLLFKLGPDDDHYDIMLEHLSASLNELGIAEELSDKILAFAESGRDMLLARGDEILKAA